MRGARRARRVALDSAEQEADLVDHIKKEVQDKLRTLLRERSMRATASRIAVLVILHEQQAPMSHEQIMARLPAGAYNKASIWRILSDLADCGLLRRMDLGDRIWRYELRGSHHTISEDHHHFLCSACGEVTCLPPLELRSKDGSLPAVLHNIEYQVRVVGRCTICTVG